MSDEWGDMAAQLELSQARERIAALESKLKDGKGHICAIQHEHRGCAWCRAEAAESKLQAALGDGNDTIREQREEIKALSSRLDSALSDLRQVQHAYDTMSATLIAEKIELRSRLDSIRDLCAPFVINEKWGKRASHSDGEIAESDLAEKVLALAVEKPATSSSPHVHHWTPNPLVPSEYVCSCGHYYVV